MLESLEHANLKRMAVEKPKMESEKYFDEYEMIPEEVWDRASDKLREEWENPTAHIGMSGPISQNFFVMSSNMKIVCPERHETLQRELHKNGVGSKYVDFLERIGEKVIARGTQVWAEWQLSMDDFITGATAVKNLATQADLRSIYNNVLKKSGGADRLFDSVKRYHQNEIKKTIQNNFKDDSFIGFLENLAMFKTAYPEYDLYSEQAEMDELRASITKALENPSMVKEHKGNLISFLHAFYPDQINPNLSEQDQEDILGLAKKLSQDPNMTSKPDRLFLRLASLKLVGVSQLKFGKEGFEVGSVNSDLDEQIPSIPEQKQF